VPFRLVHEVVIFGESPFSAGAPREDLAYGPIEATSAFRELKDVSRIPQNIEQFPSPSIWRFVIPDCWYRNFAARRVNDDNPVMKRQIHFKARGNAVRAK
jgi:hypothetical protein